MFNKMQMRSSIISHGCFLYKCDIERSIIGVRSRISAGAEIKVSETGFKLKTDS